MDEIIRLRCLDAAAWMLQHHATVRRTAAQFSIPKSSIHKDLCERLPQIDANLAAQIHALMQYNKAVRHLRGGAATRQMYLDRRKSLH